MRQPPVDPELADLRAAALRVVVDTLVFKQRLFGFWAEVSRNPEFTTMFKGEVIAAIKLANQINRYAKRTFGSRYESLTPSNLSEFASKFDEWRRADPTGMKVRLPHSREVAISLQQVIGYCEMLSLCVATAPNFDFRRNELLKEVLSDETLHEISTQPSGKWISREARQLITIASKFRGVVERTRDLEHALPRLGYVGEGLEEPPPSAMPVPPPGPSPLTSGGGGRVKQGRGGSDTKGARVRPTSPDRSPRGRGRGRGGSSNPNGLGRRGSEVVVDPARVKSTVVEVRPASPALQTPATRPGGNESMALN